MTYPFVLGTAQFGSHYGIVNSYGRPSDKEVKSIFEHIDEKGIDTLDTAFAYGDSLDRIAEIFSHKKNPQYHVINKFSVESDFEQIYVQLADFLENTGVERFYGLLIHDSQNISSQKERELLKFLHRVKNDGLVYKVGVSVYAPEDLDAVLDTYPIDLIQCPINLFDQRFLAPDTISVLHKRNIEIHARSLFLQGVLLCNELPKTLKNLYPTWCLYQSSQKDSGLSSLEFIMSWVKSIGDIDKWVFGVNTLNEISQILNSYDKCTNKFEIHWAKFNAPSNPDVDPRNWAVE